MSEPLFRPVYYSQTDSRWNNADYSAKGERTTIGKSGCGPTCAAMVLSEWGYTVTPKEACDWALKNGYKAVNQGTYYSFFEAYFWGYGFKCKQLNYSDLRTSNDSYRDGIINEINTELQMGNMVIFCFGKSKWTTSGHFVLCYRFERGLYYLNDPNKLPDNNTYQFATESELKVALKYAFVITEPANLIQSADDEVLFVSSGDGFANVRACPNTESMIFNTLPTGKEAICVDIEGKWAKIIYHGLRGYVHVNNLSDKPEMPTVSAAPWWQEAVADLRSKGIINGDGNGEYDGEQTATKGVVAQMIYNLLNYLSRE